MAYSRAIVQRAEARLQSEKEQNERSSRARIAAIYEKEPRLGEIERELRRTAAHVLAATFRRQGDPVAAMQQLKKENLALQQERDWILQAEGLEPDDLTVQPICPTCGGTGYVGAAMCECLKELCRQEQKKELTNLFGAESFEKFRLIPLFRPVRRKIPQQSARAHARDLPHGAELRAELPGGRPVAGLLRRDRAGKDVPVRLRGARRRGAGFFRQLRVGGAAVCRL